MRKSLVLATLMLLLSPSFAKADITLGVLANRGELKAKEEYSELAAQLTKDLGTNVTLLPLSIDQAADSLDNKKADLLLSNPVIAALTVEKFKAQPVATVIANGGFEFGGVIISNKAANITTSDQLKGKKVMSYGTDSAGAYIFQVYHLKQKGIDVHKDLASFVQAKKQDDIPLAVRAGLFDAGFVRTGVLESMEKKGLLKVDEFNIVDAAADAKGEVRTTPLYPEWFVTARADMPADMVGKVKTSLLALKDGAPALTKADIKGFVSARDLKPLTTVLKDLKVAPFDK